ncbi:hypothetical protein WG66_009167, partial [Moniliophthora roreri]
LLPLAFFLCKSSASSHHTCSLIILRETVKAYSRYSFYCGRDSRSELGSNCQFDRRTPRRLAGYRFLCCSLLWL